DRRPSGQPTLPSRKPEAGATWNRYAGTGNADPRRDPGERSDRQARPPRAPVRRQPRLHGRLATGALRKPPCNCRASASWMPLPAATRSPSRFAIEQEISLIAETEPTPGFGCPVHTRGMLRFDGPRRLTVTAYAPGATTPELNLTDDGMLQHAASKVAARSSMHRRNKTQRTAVTAGQEAGRGLWLEAGRPTRR
ncbi:MAG: hypothetical protein JWO88_2078, partial [Frankiales bacterium]|nr:hypothetical protein [Frankiales bacterium]